MEEHARRSKRAAPAPVPAARGKRSAELELLYEAGRLLGRTLDPAEIYETLRVLVARTMDCDGLVVSSYSADDGLISCTYAWVEGERLDPDQFPAIPLAPEGAGMQSRVIRSGEPILVEDAIEGAKRCRTAYYIEPDGSVHDQPEEGKPQSRSLAMVPIRLEGKVIGTLQVFSHRPAAYGAEELRLLEALLLQVAAASRNAYLYQQARAAEQAARERARELAEADRLKDQFLATLAHELRNPLAAISNALQVLHATEAAGPLRDRALAVLDRQVRQQARLVDDLLDVSRVSCGRVELRRERLDLGQLVEETLEDHGGLLEAAGLSVRLELPAAPVWIEGDRVRLAQALDNLLSNAAKFSEPGGEVTLSVTTAQDPRRQPSAIVKVRDTGIGISAEALPHVFDTFTQADRSLDRSRGGLGLGLALVRGLIELHGGSVTAHSDGPGQGSEFRVYLPLAVDSPQLIVDSPDRTPGSPPDYQPSTISHQLRVLIVEDSRDTAEMLRELLELAGCRVRVAHSGKAGLRLAREARPDVVLCDLGLPGMDGYAVAAALRADQATAGARLIAISGYGSDEDRRRSREAGFNLHLTKPVRFDDLRQLLVQEAVGG